MPEMSRLERLTGLGSARKRPVAIPQMTNAPDFGLDFPPRIGVSCENERRN